MRINIAIDGPSGAGKSTISDILAQKLGYAHLDTGSMYRAVAYTALGKGLKLDDEDSIVKMIEEEMDLQLNPDGSIFCNGEDISDRIRTNEISMAASDVSKLKNVRKALVAMQQKIASAKGYIVDGRDICEVVLPDAEVKIYLTASAEARAQRRYLQNKEKGIEGDYDTILEDIKKRDYQDSHRENSPLRKADDAIEVDTSEMDIEETTEYIMNIIREKTE
ncbi:MAG: (d)CMP kinase [Erysipelotrichaceae bacterium]|nr:(d)CMP kinase [Erysipelotrichaceae bacterium]